MTQRLFVIGLDCAEPSLVFDRWREELPHLRQLMEAGTYGGLESTIPPITVPAWTRMLTGKDPGELGFYGFRNRADSEISKQGSKWLLRPLSSRTLFGLALRYAEC